MRPFDGFAAAVVVLLIALAGEAKQIVMVQTLTRHGTRAPDKIVGAHVCSTIIDPEGGSVRKAFIEVFGTGPAELTTVGVRQMRDVGAFLRERYHGFLWADYPAHSRDWQFIAREGTRQQRSMAGLAQGIFPDDAVPITVTRRDTDSVLGGPAPQCAPITHEYILAWHRTKGRAMVRAHESLIKALERVCNVSLIDDPVNSIPGGANPHAYIGDISDLMDSLYEANREPLPISYAQHQELTELAFEIEQGAHFDFPGGAAMHAGEFPDHLFKAFEEVEANGGRRPNDIPKMRMHTCSRELHYGLSNIFGWQESIRIPGQPLGRIRAGTTFIWELHTDMKIRSYYYQFPDNFVRELQPPMTIAEYRAKYNAAVAPCGDWKQICVDRHNKCVTPSDKSEPPTAADPELIAHLAKFEKDFYENDAIDPPESVELAAKDMGSTKTSLTGSPENLRATATEQTSKFLQEENKERNDNPPTVPVELQTSSSVQWIIISLLLSAVVVMAFRRQRLRSDYAPV